MSTEIQKSEEKMLQRHIMARPGIVRKLSAIVNGTGAHQNFKLRHYPKTGSVSV